LVENYILHYNEDNKHAIYSPMIKQTMSNSSIILLVLSDNYLMHEWNNPEFRAHLRYLVMREHTRFVCIQLHDICDEEVEDYFRSQLQIPRFVALEDDEFMFWQKLHYHLFTNDQVKAVMPTYAPSPRDHKARPDDDIEFESYYIKRPIIHLDGCRDPRAVDNPPNARLFMTAQKTLASSYTDSERRNSQTRDMLTKEQYEEMLGAPKPIPSVLPPLKSTPKLPRPDRSEIDINYDLEKRNSEQSAQQFYANAAYVSQDCDGEKSVNLRDPEAKSRAKLIALNQESQHSYMIRNKSGQVHIDINPDSELTIN
jgi:hypothetical protein